MIEVKSDGTLEGTTLHDHATGETLTAQSFSTEGAAFHAAFGVPAPVAPESDGESGDATAKRKARA
jgi:hypothetical protein